MALARILRPAKTAMSSGTARTKRWILEFEQATPRRADPLLELRLFRSVPFSAAIVMALQALCGFSAFLFVTTQYLQDVRGRSALATGLCLLPVGEIGRAHV